MLHLGSNLTIPEKHIVAILGVDSTANPFPGGAPPATRAGRPPYKSMILVDDGLNRRVIYSPISPATLRRRLSSPFGSPSLPEVQGTGASGSV